MQDIDLIKINYSRMPDEQLLYLARTDGTSITYQAFITLKKEFRKRNLPPDIIEEIENKRNEDHIARLKNNLEEESDRINSKLWRKIFQMKFEEKSDDEIKQFLMHSGVSYEDSETAVSNMKEMSEKVVERAKEYIKTSIYAFLFSTVVLVLNYNSFISVITIYFGVVGFFSSAIAWARNDQLKNKYPKIIQNIDEQESLTKT